MKIGLHITARLKSSRLPFKLLLDLNGSTIIEHVIDRAKKVAGIDGIVLCTSQNRQDKPLVDVALAHNIYYYLGSEADVLQRVLDAATFFDFDYILSITGENPLFSIEHANQMVDLIKSQKPDYCYIDGLPIGCNVYGLSVKALAVVCQVKHEIDTEIWGPLINRPEIFNVKSISVSSFYHRQSLRLTNDYFEDYQLMQKIFSHFPEGFIPSLSSALSVLDNNPSYLDINRERVQAYPSNETLNNIDNYYNANRDAIIELKNKMYNDI